MKIIYRFNFLVFGDKMNGLDDMRFIAVAISAVSFILNIITLWILLTRSERSRPTLLWGALLMFISLWCFSEIFIKSTDDARVALNWFNLVLIAGGFVPPILVNFALEFPHRHPIIEKRKNRYLFYTLVYIPNIIPL